MGCEPYYEKRKTGAVYEYGGMTLEILEVEGLGAFLEVERLLEKDDPEEVARARKDIRSVFERAGVPESAIEPRTYSELILGKGRTAS